MVEMQDMAGGMEGIEKMAQGPEEMVKGIAKW